MHDCQLIHHRVSYVFKVISSQSRTQRYDKTNSCLSSTASSVPGRGVPHWSLEVWETTAMVVYIKIKAKEWPVFIEGSWQYYGLKPAGYVVTRIVAERERERAGRRRSPEPGVLCVACPPTLWQYQQHPQVSFRLTERSSYILRWIIWGLAVAAAVHRPRPLTRMRICS